MLPSDPCITPRSEHRISRKNISPNALKVLYRLQDADYDAYLVGGSVRDLLLDLRPKDFDIATDAHPQQIRKLFRNCRLIGRRFRLAHVHFGSEIIEVSTFRGQPPQTDETDETDASLEEGRITRDNVYGSIDDDVWRRDFTANSLFYNIRDFSVVDYTGGLEDIENRQLRLIGDPQQRYREDPVRMLRAVRFAVKLGFCIEREAAEQISKMAHLLQEIPPARLFEEFQKLLLHGHGWETFEQLRHYGLLGFLFPQTEESLSWEGGASQQELISLVLQDSDRRCSEQQACSPGFILAALLWHPMRALFEEYSCQDLEKGQAIELAGDDVISQQTKSVSMPRRFTCMARDIWRLQESLQNTRSRGSARLRRQVGLRAAYDFLVHRYASGEDLGLQVEHWRKFVQEQPPPSISRGRRRSRGR